MAAKVIDNGATFGYESELWAMADAMRGSMDAAEYKHVVLGLIFLKYISDAFEERHAIVLEKWGRDAAEDRDEYVSENIFWVPQEARWALLKSQARQPTIGQTVDRAMIAIERDNTALKQVLPKDYARPALDNQRLGQLIDMIGNIQVGDAKSRSRDLLGRVYEYFLSQFASAEGKRGGEFYTPRCVVKLLVEMLEPFEGPSLRSHAADPRACSCSRSSSYLPTPAAAECGAKGSETTDFDLRPRVELHDLAVSPDEPGNSRHQWTDCPRRQFPRRPAPGSEGRFHPCQPPVQRIGLGWRTTR